MTCWTAVLVVWRGVLMFGRGNGLYIGIYISREKWVVDERCLGRNCTERRLVLLYGALAEDVVYSA